MGAWWRKGRPMQLFAHPREDYTRALMAAAFSLEADESLAIEDDEDVTPAP